MRWIRLAGLHAVASRQFIYPHPWFRRTVLSPRTEPVYIGSSAHPNRLFLNRVRMAAQYDLLSNQIAIRACACRREVRRESCPPANCLDLRANPERKIARILICPVGAGYYPWRNLADPAGRKHLVPDQQAYHRSAGADTRATQGPGRSFRSRRGSCRIGQLWPC